MRRTILSCCLLAFLAVTSGCYTLTHNVGAGAPAGSSTVASKRQWYVLWGLVPLGKADGGEMAKEKGMTSDYTVKSGMGFLDVILNMITGILTVSGQTVSVSGTPGATATTAAPVLSTSDSLAKGNQAMGAKDYNAALQYYQAAVAADPNSADAYMGLGTCYYYLGKKADAVKAYERSLALNPGNAQLANFLKTLK